MYIRACVCLSELCLGKLGWLFENAGMRARAQKPAQVHSFITIFCCHRIPFLVDLYVEKGQRRYTFSLPLHLSCHRIPFLVDLILRNRPRCAPIMDLIVRMLETAAQQMCSLLFGSGGAGWASVVRATCQNQQKQ